MLFFVFIAWHILFVLRSNNKMRKKKQKNAGNDETIQHEKQFPLTTRLTVHTISIVVLHMSWLQYLYAYYGNKTNRALSVCCASEDHLSTSTRT